MASTPHPPPKHPEPPAHKRDDDARPPVTRNPPAPSGTSDPQEMKLELAARDQPPETKLREYVPGQPYDPAFPYATIGDEQRARSAAMEAAGGPEAWMKAQEEESAPDARETRRGVVPGVGSTEKR